MIKKAKYFALIGGLSAFIIYQIVSALNSPHLALVQKGYLLSIPGVDMKINKTPENNEIFYCFEKFFSGASLRENDGTTTHNPHKGPSIDSQESVSCRMTHTDTTGDKAIGKLETTLKKNNQGMTLQAHLTLKGPKHQWNIRVLKMKKEENKWTIEEGYEWEKEYQEEDFSKVFGTENPKTRFVGLLEPNNSSSTRVLSFLEEQKVTSTTKTYDPSLGWRVGSHNKTASIKELYSPFKDLTGDWQSISDYCYNERSLEKLKNYCYIKE